MTEEPNGRQRRVRRSTRVSQTLARARERNNRQLVQIRERERQIDQALGDYVAASEQIAVTDQLCRDKVTQWEDRIRQARAERDDTLADVRRAQARAVLAIHTAGRTVKQVAELLELPEKTTRQMIGHGRGLPAAPATSGRAGVPASTDTAEAGTPDYRVPAPEYGPRTARVDELPARQ